MPVLVDKPLPEMTERLGFDVGVLRSGTSEARNWSREPRNGFTLRLAMLSDRYARLEEELRVGVRGDWTVPLWHERTRGLDLALGQTVLPVSVAADYRVGSQALIWKGCDEYELATVDAVGLSDTITLSSGLGAAYSGASVMPAHLCYIQTVAITRDLAKVMRIDLQATLRETTDLAASVWGEYLGSQILGCAFRPLAPLAGALAIGADYVDFSDVTIEDVREAPEVRFGVEVVQHAWEMKQFLHQIQGRDAPFWVRSWGGDLTVSAAALGASTIDAVQTRAGTNLVGRHVDLAGQRREITDATDGATQTLTLDAPLSAAVPAGASAGLISLVRSETDVFTFERLGTIGARIAFPVIEVAA